MVNDRIKRAARRTLDRLADEVTLRNQTATTDANGDPIRDDHGNIEWASATETTVPSRVIMRGQPTFSRRADGIDDEIEGIALVSDQETVRDGSGGDADRATRITYGGETYAVRDVFDDSNGLLRAHLVHED